MNKTVPPYRYQPKTDESDRKIKHEWDKPEAGFREDATGHPEGMCPSTITEQQATALLNSGLHDSPTGWHKSHPKHIYNIHEGVVYKAVETNPGTSYHGFPCPGPRTHPKKQDMSERMKRKLLEKAKAEGCLPQIEAWFREHP